MQSAKRANQYFDNTTVSLKERLFYTVIYYSQNHFFPGLTLLVILILSQSVPEVKMKQFGLESSTTVPGLL